MDILLDGIKIDCPGDFLEEGEGSVFAMELSESGELLELVVRPVKGKRAALYMDASLKLNGEPVPVPGAATVAAAGKPAGGAGVTVVPDGAAVTAAGAAGSGK